MGWVDEMTNEMYVKALEALLHGHNFTDAVFIEVSDENRETMTDVAESKGVSVVSDYGRAGSIIVPEINGVESTREFLKISLPLWEGKVAVLTDFDFIAAAKTYDALFAELPPSWVHIFPNRDAPPMAWIVWDYKGCREEYALAELEWLKPIA